MSEVCKVIVHNNNYCYHSNVTIMQKINDNNHACPDSDLGSMRVWHNNYYYALL